MEEWRIVYIPKFPKKLFELLRGAPISRGFYQLDAFFGALCTIFPAESIELGKSARYEGAQKVLHP